MMIPNIDKPHINAKLLKELLKEDIKPEQAEWLWFYYLKKLNNWRSIAKSETQDDSEEVSSIKEKELRKKYENKGGIFKYFEDKGTKPVSPNAKNKFADLYSLWDNSPERRTGFKNDFNAFLRWYTRMPPYCCYCGVKKESLGKYFDKENNIQYKDIRKRGDKLEVERIITAPKEKNIYTKENCALACYICNNAKSNFITWGKDGSPSTEGFKPIAQGIRNFWLSVNGVELEPFDKVWLELECRMKSRK